MHLFWIIAAMGMPLAAQSTTPCTSLSDSTKRMLVSYVREKYQLPDSISLDLASDRLVSGTCCHRLTFQGVSSLKQWELQLFLSSDGRYLTTDLFDTTVDPVQEERRRLQTLMAGLAENKGASIGPDHAPVTIVEFSDFQCPYCKKFAEIVKEVLPSEANNVRIVFHHMPLSMHSWARTAAEGAACAQLQSSKAFWSVHDQIFSNQSNITVGNIKTELERIARATPGLDFAGFQACLGDDMSLGLVLRDIDLATSNQITGTPTLFINGHRIAGVKDATELRELITQAVRESDLHPPTLGGSQ